MLEYLSTKKERFSDVTNFKSHSFVNSVRTNNIDWLRFLKVAVTFSEFMN